VFTDLLAIPDSAPGMDEPYDDTAREARTFALTWLDGEDDGDRFVRLYEDEEAQAAGIARYRGVESGPGAVRPAPGSAG
jgi:hypothetical protein